MGSEIIASFLDAQAIDEFVVTVALVFNGDGISLIARHHRHMPLNLQAVERFEDGVVQLRYRVQYHFLMTLHRTRIAGSLSFSCRLTLR
jgi:dihydrofolate reductase